METEMRSPSRLPTPLFPVPFAGRSELRLFFWMAAGLPRNPPHVRQASAPFIE
jgi:hypothetical protein